MNDAQKKLLGMLARVFSDAEADADEQEQIRKYLASGALGVKDTRDVLERFVAQTWRITMADGVVSEIEKKRLRNVVHVLGIDASLLPEGWSALL